MKDIQCNEYRAIKVYDKKKIIKILTRKKLNNPKEEELKSYIDGFKNEINYMKMIYENGNINAVKYYDHKETEDEFSIIMELCDDNLLNLFSNRKQNFSSKEIFDFLNQLNNSFKIMEKKKIVHRALNLENILVNYKNKEKTSYIFKLKLTDDSIQLYNFFHKKNSEIKGNINYFAPEILKNQNYYEKCDLWSLGIIIYILLFRENPFYGEKKIILKQTNQIKELKLKKTDDNNLNNLIKNLLIEEPKNRLSWNKYFLDYFRYNNDYTDYYTIEKIIKKTEYAVVYKAIEKKTKEYRAIKVFNKSKIKKALKEIISDEPTENDMKQYFDGFYNEIKYMKMIYDEGKNNYVVIFYEYFDTKDEFSIVMELCDDNLLNYFSKENKSFDEKSISDILNQLNNSFKIMTKNKIVHRALNLKNILIKFINKDLIYKLKLTNDSCLLEYCFKKSKFNLQRNIDYYAPEILNKQNYNEKCDLWSLGVIIYVLIFKKLPSKNGDILNQFNLLEPNLNDLIKKLLTKDQRKRINWDQYFNHPFFLNLQNRDYKDYYDIEEKIGESEYSTVYKAKDKRNNEDRAIEVNDINLIKVNFKRININEPNTVEIKPYIQGFYNEIENMKKIQNGENKYALRYYEYFYNNNEFDIVMDPYDENLLDYLSKREKPFNPKEIYDILNQLNISFKKMAENKIIHRELNLENILIKHEKNKEEFIVKLKLTDDILIADSLINKKILKTHNIRFLAPEILKENGNIEKCDLWSLGIIIYILYFKEYPYDGDYKDQILDKIHNNKLNEINNKDLTDLIQKLLVENPTNRLSWNEYFKHRFFKK